MTDPAYARLPEAVDSGAISVEAVDACVRRVLEAKLRLGLFDQPYVDEERARTVLAEDRGTLQPSSTPLSDRHDDSSPTGTPQGG